MSILDAFVGKMDQVFGRKFDATKMMAESNKKYVDDLMAKQRSRGDTETKIVLIDGDEVACFSVDYQQEYQRLRAKTPEVTIRKKSEVIAYQATQDMELPAAQDGTVNYAVAGDWIIQNPGDPYPYPFGSKKHKDGTPTTVEERQQDFASKYELVTKDEKTGQTKYRKSALVKAVPVDRNITFQTSWGEMSVTTGGYLTDQGYSIAASSFAKDYELVPEK